MKNARIKYVGPRIDVTRLDFECAIAAGSAIIHVGDTEQEVHEEWMVDEDDWLVIDW